MAPCVISQQASESWGHQLRPVGLRVPVELDIQTQSQEDGRLSGSLPGELGMGPGLHAVLTSSQSLPGSLARALRLGPIRTRPAAGGLPGRNVAVLRGPRGRRALAPGPAAGGGGARGRAAVLGARGPGRQTRRGCRPRRNSFRRI